MRKAAILVPLLVAFALVTIGVGCASSADGTGATVVTTGTPKASTEGVGAPQATATTEALPTTEATTLGTRENPLPLGTTAKVGDWEVTVAKVTLNANEVVAKANEFNKPPVDGSQYVLVGLSGKYVGEKSGTFWVDMMEKFLGGAGNTFDSGGETFAVPPDPMSDAGETFPGASVSGNIIFEVPTDQIEGAALIVEQTFNLDDTRTFFAVK